MRSKRVIYGTRPMTAKQLAMHLSKRCMRELPNAVSETQARDESIRRSRDAKARKEPRPPSRYVIASAWTSKFDEPDAWKFEVSEQHLAGGNNYEAEWTARIVVTPQLDVEVYEGQGRSDLRAIERALLGCALRGEK